MASLAEDEDDIADRASSSDSDSDGSDTSDESGSEKASLSSARPFAFAATGGGVGAEAGAEAGDQPDAQAHAQIDAKSRKKRQKKIIKRMRRWAAPPSRHLRIVPALPILRRSNRSVPLGYRRAVRLRNRHRGLCRAAHKASRRTELQPEQIKGEQGSALPPHPSRAHGLVTRGAQPAGRIIPTRTGLCGRCLDVDEEKIHEELSNMVAGPSLSRSRSQVSTTQRSPGPRGKFQRYVQRYVALPPH